MIVLAGHRAEPAHLPEQPLDLFGARTQIAGEELAGLLGEIEQDGAGFEHRDRRAAARRDHDRRCAGMRLFGDTSRNLRSNCSPFPMLIGNDFVFQPGLFEKDRDLVAVGSRPVIEIDHRANSLTPNRCEPSPSTEPRRRNRPAPVISDESTALAIRFHRPFCALLACRARGPAASRTAAAATRNRVDFRHLPQLAFAPPRVRIP